MNSVQPSFRLIYGLENTLTGEIAIVTGAGFAFIQPVIFCGVVLRRLTGFSIPAPYLPSRYRGL